MTDFVNARILLTEELTFNKVSEALIKLGYRWRNGALPTVEFSTNINCIVTHTDGTLKYSTMNRDSFDWKTHPGVPSTILKGDIVPTPWVRGDKGPAPNNFIFEDGTPPTLEECPDGYLTSSCGTKYQNSNAILAGMVGIVLMPTKQFDIGFKVTQPITADVIKRAMFRAGIYIQNDYDLGTENGLFEMFQTFAQFIGHTKSDEYSALFTGVIDKQTPWAASGISEGLDSWEIFYTKLLSTNSLPIAECIKEHESFIKEFFDLEFQDKMRTMNDIIEVYNLVTTNCSQYSNVQSEYSTIYINEGEWDLAT